MMVCFMETYYHRIRVGRLRKTEKCITKTPFSIARIQKRKFEILTFLPIKTSFSSYNVL